MKSMVSQTLLDRVGACASTLCAIHCLLTGAAMGLLAVSGLTFLTNPWVEGGFLTVAAVVGVTALWHGIRRHHSWIPATVFVAGIACIAISFLVGHGHVGGSHSHDAHHYHSSPLGTGLAVAGGLLVAAFHFVNQKLQHRKCSCCAATK